MTERRTDQQPVSVLVVDNYDSFAYNLVQYVGEALLKLGYTEPEARSRVTVRRNDAITTEDIRALDPAAIVVSPGPGTPTQAGVSVPLFRELSYPTLGVCLGHQALCAANGAPVGHAADVVHGKPSVVAHDGKGIYRELPAEFTVGRYHSLAVDRQDLPETLVETARTDGPGRAASTGSSAASTPADDQGVVMGVRHREKPHEGVQFHPESILTEGGETLVRTFVGDALAP